MLWETYVPLVFEGNITLFLEQIFKVHCFSITGIQLSTSGAKKLPSNSEPALF
jgi:hypothetical protein